jgi:hypothetical protein
LNALRRDARDPGDGGRAGGPPPGDLPADDRVGAGPFGEQVGVAGLDGLDEFLDVVGPQFVQFDVAEVRDEVDADVRLVEEPGAGLDADPFQPHRQVLGQGRHAGDRGVGGQPPGDGVHLGQDPAGADGGLHRVGDLDTVAPVPAGDLEQPPGVGDLPFGDLVLLDAEAAQLPPPTLGRRG